MISWQQEEYLDPGIWNHLKSTICPEILSAPTVLLVPSLQVPASLPSASSSEHLDPTFKQCHTFTTMYSAAYGQVLRRRITEEAMIMPVENRRDRNICYYIDQPRSQTLISRLMKRQQMIQHCPLQSHLLRRQWQHLEIHLFYTLRVH